MPRPRFAREETETFHDFLQRFQTLMIRNSRFLCVSPLWPSPFPFRGDRPKKKKAKQITRVTVNSSLYQLKKSLRNQSVDDDPTRAFSYAEASESYPVLTHATESCFQRPAFRAPLLPATVQPARVVIVKP
jgi:hypothetical protein